MYDTKNADIEKIENGYMVALTTPRETKENWGKTRNVFAPDLDTAFEIIREFLQD